MEAHTLGGLDTTFYKPSFDIESNAKYMKNVQERRRPLFITDLGKQEFERLFRLREEYYQQGKFKS